jgi:hypothetical protein
MLSKKTKSISPIACLLLVNTCVPVSCVASPDLFKVESPKVDNSPSAGGVASKPTGKRTLKGSVYEEELYECGIEVTEKMKAAGAPQHIVEKVLTGSKAEKWGILPGDIILSLQTKSSSINVTIERAGKIYAADLARDRQTESEPIQQEPAVTTAVPAPAMQKVRRPHEEMVGHFVGALSGGGDITTEIEMAPAGNLYGSYHQILADGPYTGKLDKAVLGSDRKVTFVWSDVFGSGTCTVTFSPDYSSFDGVWITYGRGNFTREWTGVRSP